MTGLCCTLTGASYKTDVYMVIYATWVSSTDMADFDLSQTFPVPCDELVVTLHDSFKRVIYWDICWVVDVCIVYSQLFN